MPQRIDAAPRAWPPDDAEIMCPRVVDLLIHRHKRHHGFGIALMTEIDAICRQMEFLILHLGIDPLEQREALAFYRTLGCMLSPRRRSAA